MSNRLRTVLEVIVGVGLAGASIYFWVPRGQAAPEPLSLIPMSAAAASAIASTESPGRGGVTLVVFNDFQCPWCARFDSVLADLEHDNPSIQVTFRHRPLTNIHAAAFDAAVSSECARKQGRFDAYARLLFREQSSIGTRSWSSFARDAGIRDTVRFAACVAGDSTARAIVRRDLAASASLRSRGTPAFVIDGQEPNRPPSANELRDLLLARAASR